MSLSPSLLPFLPLPLLPSPSPLLPSPLPLLSSPPLSLSSPLPLLPSPLPLLSSPPLSLSSPPLPSPSPLLPSPLPLLFFRLKLDLVILGGDGTVIEQLELTDLSHLANYSQPHAPGALLKAAFICTDIVQFPSEVSLADQLSKFGSGFMLQSMSSLPQGSGKWHVHDHVTMSITCSLGMGTSSILGGAIMAAIWRAAGHQHSYDSLIHSVSLSLLTLPLILYQFHPTPVFSI